MANYFINAKTEIEAIQHERETLLNKAANTLSSVLINMNNAGVSNMKTVETDINKLLVGFTPEERESILLRAIVKLTMNL